MLSRCRELDLSFKQNRPTEKMTAISASSISSKINFHWISIISIKSWPVKDIVDERDLTHSLGTHLLVNIHSILKRRWCRNVLHFLRQKREAHARPRHQHQPAKRAGLVLPRLHMHYAQVTHSVRRGGQGRQLQDGEGRDHGQWDREVQPLSPECVGKESASGDGRIGIWTRGWGHVFVDAFRLQVLGPLSR